jgi:hypothetical protein
MTREFNGSVEEIFGNTSPHESVHQEELLSSHFQTSNGILSRQEASKLKDSAIDHIFSCEYRVAGQELELLGLYSAQKYGPSAWPTVGTELIAAFMNAAAFPGCPQTVIARFAQELSRFSMRETQKYNLANPQTRSLTELRQTLATLKANTECLAALIGQQRALRIWEPILGPEHPKIKLIRDEITFINWFPNRTEPERESWLAQAERNLLPGTLNLGEILQLKSIGGLLCLGEGPPDDLLAKFHALESSDIAGHQIQQDIAHLQYGRSRSLLGGYYSFLKRFDEAEKAFQESDRYMKYENCVEIKLHRMLWYAEHKTRVHDEEGVGMLVCQAHEIFMKNDSPSEFVIAHFPDRFYYLCKAVSKRVPIDEVVNGPIESISSNRRRSVNHPASIHHNIADAPSPAATSVLSPERLFPLSPGGFNAAIDIDTWRQFVNFSPTMDSLRREQPKHCTRMINVDNDDPPTAMTNINNDWTS